MRRFLLSLALLLAFALPVFFAFAVPARAEEFTRAQIEQIVREFIDKNPKFIMDSVDKYAREQQEASDAKVGERIKEFRGWLYENPEHAEAGNPKGDITIVEFFDYNCGYCKQALNEVMTLLDKDKNLRLVFVEIPILGDSSTLAAKWALAAKNQGRYLEFHIALMRHKGPITEIVLTDFAKTAGLDMEKLKEDLKDPKIDTVIQNNMNGARALSIQGTPAFIIGTQLVRGYVGMAELEKLVAIAREEKK